MANIQNITALVFNNYETLDLFGVVEVFGRFPDRYRIQYASLNGGIITNAANIQLVTQPISTLEKTDILLIVGGQGTRSLVNDTAFLTALQTLSNQASHVLSVCTGSALLAKAGVLDGKRATSNKRAWQWVIAQSDKVNWVEKARWVVDGKFYTSSGVSAGIDMAFGFIADTQGVDVARQTAFDIEYRWAEDKENDEFCRS